MNRRPSYASVAAGASISSGMLDYTTPLINRTNDPDSNNPIFDSSNDPEYRSSPPATTSSPLHSSHRNTASQMASQRSLPPPPPPPQQQQQQQQQQQSQLDLTGAPLEPDQLAPPWKNQLVKTRNLAIHGRHTQLGGFGAGGYERFIMPSYLAGSRYMTKLVAKQYAREAAIARREAEEVGIGSVTVRPSRSSSSVNLTASHRLSIASHRGIAYDVVEARPPESVGRTNAVENEITSLPSRWKMTGSLEIFADGTGLRWLPSQKTGEAENMASALTDNSMPVASGLYYYEVQVDQLPRGGHIALGVAPSNINLCSLPGWEPRTWCWHSDDGKKYHGQQSGSTYSREWGKNDTVGCGVNFWKQSIFFTRNGNRLENAFENLDKFEMAKLYPCVGMKAPGATVRVNFGQEAFQYDITAEMARNRDEARQQYMSTKLSRVTNGKKDSDFIKELVAQFLRHGGYVETARAFISEVQMDHDALGAGWRISGNAAEEDIDAAQRQQIRSAILTGDVEKAIRCTNDFYPQVLPANPIIDFRLKCRRFLEMIKRTTVQGQSGDNGIAAAPVSPTKKEKAKATLPGSAMDLDEPVESGRTGTNGDAYGIGTSTVDLQAAIDEGQQLSAEYGNHPKKEVREMMKSIMGIWAYDEPTKSKEVGYLFTQAERFKTAEELNGAILESMGKSSVAAVERMAQQTQVLIEELTEPGLPGAFVNLERGLLG